jgi:hypothetical protein
MSWFTNATNAAENMFMVKKVRGFGEPSREISFTNQVTSGLDVYDVPNR